MLSHNYSYSVLKSSWGIEIDIAGECTSMSNYVDNNACKNLDHGLWIIVKDDILLDIELEYLYKGLKMVSDSIISNSPYKSDTLIIINSVSYCFCDYQEDGLVPAIIYWAASLFNFEAPKIEVSFNKEANRYEFAY